MPRRATDFQSIRSEGGLLPPDLLRRVMDPNSKLEGTQPEDYGLPRGERLNEAITESWKRLRKHWSDFRATFGTASAESRVANGGPPTSLVSPPPSLVPPHSPPAEGALTGLTNDRWNLPLLRELGFGLLPTTAAPEVGGRTYAINRFFGPVAVHLIGCGLSLDRRAAGVRGAAAANPHGLVQEFLNRSPAHVWAILSNGLRLRILRDNQALSRQSYLEFDLETMFAGELYSDFVLLWLVAHATRFAPREDNRADTCWLERWTKIAQDEGTRALTDLRGGVEKALEILGQGFVSHLKNTALRDALRKGEVKLSDLHGQLLRIVYRLIFLFVAEDRELAGIPILHPPIDVWNQAREKQRGLPEDSPSPPAAGGEGRGGVGSSAFDQARERYVAHYSTRRLRELASRIKGSRHGDLWRQFQLTVGALSGDARFGAVRDALALPSLGSLLWNPAATSLLNGVGLADGKAGGVQPYLSAEGAELSNFDFLEALRHLAFTRQGKVLRPVDYKNLGSEEFGGVYETFLELTPQISSDGARFTFAEFAGNERKTSGSYYTPDSLVQCLLDSALDPVVEARLADAERLAKLDWTAVEKEIQSDPAKRTYVLAFLSKHASASKTASSGERKRAWDSVPPTSRRWRLSEEGILAIKVCDMACGSGHFLVGAGHRLARHLARVRALAAGESEPSPLLYQTALRDVIGHCLYGVDINPMAVELCKVTLWLEALEPGKPLSFLDHHIRCGNSLLGATPELIAAGLPDEAFDAIEGDDKAACSALRKRNKAEREGFGGLFAHEDAALRDKFRQAAAAIDEIGDSRPEDIQRKEAAFRAGQSNYDFQRARDLADLWCAAFVIPKRFPGGASMPASLASSTLPGGASAPASQAPSAIGDSASAIASPPPAEIQTGLFGGAEEAPTPKAKSRKPSTLNLHPSASPWGITTQHLRDFVEGGALPDGLLGEGKRLAGQYRFFHWHLAFPEVFAQGGFDLSLGNPPWDLYQFDAREFFASRDPGIASTISARKRRDMGEALLQTAPTRYQEYLMAKRTSDAIQHLVHHTGRFPLTSVGRLNSAPLFAEASIHLLNVGGRSGLVVPASIAFDTFNRFFFDHLTTNGRVHSLFGFQEIRQFFPDTDSRIPFCLLCVSGSTRFPEGDYVFDIQNLAELADPDRHVCLSRSDMQLFNPNTLTCPILRSRRAASILTTVYRAIPVIRSEGGDSSSAVSPWRFGSLLLVMLDSNNEDLQSTESLVAKGGRLLGARFHVGGDTWLPVVEGKMIDQFNHRFASYENVEGERPSKLPEALSTDLTRPDYAPSPFYWLPERVVAERFARRAWNRHWVLAWRDVTNAAS